MKQNKKLATLHMKFVGQRLDIHFLKALIYLLLPDVKFHFATRNAVIKIMIVFPI